MTFTLLEAAIYALFYYLGTCEIPFFYLTWKQPLFLGLVYGLIYHNVTEGMVLGAFLAMFYAGNIPLAATIIQDQALACNIAFPLAFKTGMGAEAALLVAAPFGILGGTLDSFRRLYNGRWNRMINKDIDEGKFNHMLFSGWIYPILFQFVLRFVPAFVLLLLGGQGLAALIYNLPPFVTKALSAVGGMLPALGMILVANNIGQPKLVPFFFLGMILMKALGFTQFQFAVVAALVSFVYVEMANDCADLDDGGFVSDDEDAKNEGVLTKKDIYWTGVRIWWFHRTANSLEFLYGTGYSLALLPALKKIYKDNVEGLKAALHRHTLPYMSEMSFGNVITGAALAMEEEVAKGSEEVTGEDIVKLKSSFMGPMASFGDTIIYTTIQPIIHAMVIPFAADGAVWPAFWPVAWFILTIPNIYFPTGCLGYFTGRKAIITLMRSGLIKKVMAGAGVMGMMMMGVVCSTNVKIATSLKWVVNAGQVTEKTVVLQEILDKLMPNLLPLIFVAFCYFFINKGGKYTKLILIICLIGLVGTLVKFF